MQIISKTISLWPKLAWAATFKMGDKKIEVFHGPMVETRENWIAEAVWKGPFESGDFDKTDLIAGSGIRVRDHQVIFVGSGSAMDRLWYAKIKDKCFVANSLPAMLALTGTGLRRDYKQYVDDILSVNCGRGTIYRYVRTLPSTGGVFNLLYFKNLIYDGKRLLESEKPDKIPAFNSYADYVSFLHNTAADFGANASDKLRRFAIQPLATISAGYDAAAAAAIAKYAGCKNTVTIKNSTSFWRGSDSGAAIARHLGYQCTEYSHNTRHYRDEAAIWAATGQPRGMNYTIFDYPEPLTLFFTGNYGEMAWDLGMGAYTEPASDISGLCLCEFRLIKGVFHCIPAWWGARHLEKIHAISHSDEMKLWRLNNGYDRPIPRRILEEAGVPRNLFGIRKMNTSSDTVFRWPFSRENQRGFSNYIQTENRAWLSYPSVIEVIRKTAKIENLVYKNLMRRMGMKYRCRPWLRISQDNLLFQWANHTLRQIYDQGYRGTKRQE